MEVAVLGGDRNARMTIQAKHCPTRFRGDACLGMMNGSAARSFAVDHAHGCAGLA